MTLIRKQISRQYSLKWHTLAALEKDVMKQNWMLHHFSAHSFSLIIWLFAKVAVSL